MKYLKYLHYLFYRLISENTVEENVLKNANQKHLLDNFAVDDRSFDISYFRKVWISRILLKCDLLFFFLKY